MENQAIIKLEYYNELKETERFYKEITYTEYSVRRESWGAGSIKTITTNDQLIKDLVLEKNKLIEEFQKTEQERSQLEYKLTRVNSNASTTKTIEGFWNKIKFLITGEIK